MLNITSIEALLNEQGFIVLDGGLATELEKSGHTLDHPLWSAHLLTTDPEAIRNVHLAYLHAGADCLITASYQTSISGLTALGHSKGEAKSIIAGSVELACNARDSYLSGLENQQAPRIRPVVVASVGPYGAYLADGSEYTGNYGISYAELRNFHETRWRTLCETQADLLGCETIPSWQEANALQDLLTDSPGVCAWISFSCRDGRHICDGTPLVECASGLANNPQVVAVGVNCTAPRYIESLIHQARMGAPNKPIVVYPNSGEIYDAGNRAWMGTTDPSDFGTAAQSWIEGGASLIGGCCRTGPSHIRSIRRALVQHRGKEGHSTSGGTRERSPNDANDGQVDDRSE